jgi:nitrate/TMAO reductase-like tetraheme cytochrome c subunit
VSSFIKNTILIVTGTVFLSLIAVIADSYTKGETSDSELCLSCHEDNELYMEKDGKKISVFVDPGHYKNTVHAGAECVDCHI